jgi:hypothetical protein
MVDQLAVLELELTEAHVGRRFQAPNLVVGGPTGGGWLRESHCVVGWWQGAADLVDDETR